jgi:hypothetical protein
MSSWLLGGQRSLAEYSRSGLSTGEDTTSLHREDVTRALNTAKDMWHFMSTKFMAGVLNQYGARRPG